MLYTHIQTALGSWISLAVFVSLIQNTQVDTTDAAAGKMLKISTQVRGAQAANAREKPTAHRMLLAHFARPL